LETVTFTSNSGDPDGSVTSQAWDTDNDGLFDDGTTKTVTKKFTSAGSYTVRLRVTDNNSPPATSILSQTVFVGNRPPVAGFGYSPAAPADGDTVTFFSTSSDPDSPITGYKWDLDGNGSVDATGPTASRAYRAGGYNVTLTVTDSEGASAFQTQTLNVAARPPPGITRSQSGPQLMSPFPVVRVTGTIGRRGSRLRRLTVSAPDGATVLVRCKGKGRSCPFGRLSRVVKSGKTAAGRAPAAEVVRVRKFERRLLRAGTIVKIFVTKPGVIGKYTRFKIRAAQPPRRSDRCLMPASTRPVNCPSS